MGQALLVRRGGSGTGNVFAFIVATYPEGSTCTCSKGAKTFTAKGTTIPYVFFIPEAGTWTVTSTNGTDTATVDVVISSAGQSESVSLNYSLQLADISITGIEGTDYIKIDDGDGNWRTKVLTTQTVTFLKAGTIDIFMVGGGAGGGSGAKQNNGSGGGGGSGFTDTILNVAIAEGTSVTVTIGAGGVADAAGGETSISELGLAVSGGNPGKSSFKGGNGGSGGGGNTPGHGGSNGSNGEGSDAGTGQGTTTREFGEETGDLYASGGNGNVSGAITPDPVGDNTGTGGSGGTGNQYTSIEGNPGYSGIIVFRNARGAA